MTLSTVEIIYEDKNIIVINKPTGVSVTADRSGDAQLIDLLTGRLGPQKTNRLRLVHRLDKGTSGVMILALNPHAQSVFSGYFEKRLILKTYLALVTGAVLTPQGTINAPLAQNRKKPQLMRIDQKRGKEAVTNWKLLANFGTASLLAVTPTTGRTHQIRVHLLSIGLPIAIDPLYAASKPLLLSDFKADYRLGSNKTEKPLIDRLTLHAYQLSLPAEPKPDIGNPIGNSAGPPDCFVARLDRKFAATIKMLAKYNAKGLDAFVDAEYFYNIVDAQPLIIR